MSDLLTIEGKAEAVTHTVQATGIAARLELWIESYPDSAFNYLTALYLIVTLSVSSLKLLWLDELITLHIARLGSAAAIWHALGQGVDPNPPVTHLLVHYSRLLFGEHEFALRLPAIIGYWIGMVSLFQYLRRRVPAMWALSGVMLSMSMAAFDWSFESRSYGIFYGLAMLAFWCWTVMEDESRTVTIRRRAYAGMIFALAAGISTNYFAVLAFLPIAAGELARDLQMTFGSVNRRGRTESTRMRFAVWAGLLAAATPLLVYRPLIARSIAQFGPYAWNKVSLAQVSDSYTQMVEIALDPILTLVVLLIIAAGLGRSYGSLCSRCREVMGPQGIAEFALHARRSRFGIPIHEGVGIAFLMAYPLLGYVVASIRGGMLSPRFVIPVCFGFAILGTLVAFRLFGYFRHAGLVALALWTAWFVCREAVVGYWYEEQKQCFYKVVDRVPEAERMAGQGVPIVIPDPLLALTFQHYAPPAMAARVVFPVDFPAIRRSRHDDSPEENLWAGRQLIYTLPIMPLAKFQKTAGNYLILASDGNWLVDDLREHHYPVRALDINTRAGELGGFTPLSRGVPVFYVTSGNSGAALGGPSPIEFRASDNLPDAR